MCHETAVHRCMIAFDSEILPMACLHLGDRARLGLRTLGGILYRAGEGGVRLPTCSLYPFHTPIWAHSRYEQNWTLPLYSGELQ